MFALDQLFPELSFEQRNKNFNATILTFFFHSCICMYLYVLSVILLIKTSHPIKSKKKIFKLAFIYDPPCPPPSSHTCITFFVSLSFVSSRTK